MTNYNTHLGTLNGIGDRIYKIHEEATKYLKYSIVTLWRENFIPTGDEFAEKVEWRNGWMKKMDVELFRIYIWNSCTWSVYRYSIGFLKIF